MTTTQPKPVTARTYEAHRGPEGSRLLTMPGTTDPEDFAILYLVTTFSFFMAGGAMALLMRAEPADDVGARPLRGTATR